jgi:hypothetical protein
MEAAQFPVVVMPPLKRSTLPKLHLGYQEEEEEPPGYQAHPRPWCTKAYDFSPRQCLPLFDSAAHLVADLAMKLVMGFFRSSTSSRKEGNKRKVRMNGDAKSALFGSTASSSSCSDEASTTPRTALPPLSADKKPTTAAV